MVIALIISLVAICLILVQLIRYKKELRHMAQFLESYDLAGNASLKVDLHSKSVENLAHAINVQAQKYQAEQRTSQQQQRNFQASLAHLSHDIRTPLAGAQGYMHLLQAESDQDLRDHYQQAVVRRLGDLNHMLDQLFVFTQVIDPEYLVEQEKVDVVEVLADTLAGFYPEFKKQAVEPRIVLEQESYQVIANKEALARILKNLIQNTLQHGTGEVCIQQNMNILRFSNPVADPYELDMERLFDRFYKSDSTRSGQGSGLGLAIVAQLADMIKAQVEAHLEGDSLHITLTLNPATRQEEVDGFLAETT